MPRASRARAAAHGWRFAAILLELSYRTDAGEVLGRLVAEIWTRYGLKAG